MLTAFHREDGQHQAAIDRRRRFRRRPDVATVMHGFCSARWKNAYTATDEPPFVVVPEVFFRRGEMGGSKIRDVGWSVRGQCRPIDGRLNNRWGGSIERARQIAERLLRLMMSVNGSAWRHAHRVRIQQVMRCAAVGVACLTCIHTLPTRTCQSEAVAAPSILRRVFAVERLKCNTGSQSTRRAVTIRWTYVFCFCLGAKNGHWTSRASWDEPRPIVTDQRSTPVEMLLFFIAVVIADEIKKIYIIIRIFHKELKSF